MKNKWIIGIVLIGSLPSLVVAQQPGPSGLTGPTVSELRIAVEGQPAPLPTAHASQQLVELDALS